MTRRPFVWKEIEHWTGGDLLETILLIDDEEDAADFMEAYAAACEDEDHAIHNVRYLLQIHAADTDDEDAQEAANTAADLFMVDMPAQAEVISPRHWWKGSSLGIKSEAEAA
jgi:hypothetical protein